jgi:F-type H+-transporting ATPase subunit delta
MCHQTHPSILLQAIRQNLAEAQKVISGNASEEDKVEARIEVEVYEALQNAVSR